MVTGGIQRFLTTQSGHGNWGMQRFLTTQCGHGNWGIQRFLTTQCRHGNWGMQGFLTTHSGHGNWRMQGIVWHHHTSPAYFWILVIFFVRMPRICLTKTIIFLIYFHWSSHNCAHVKSLNVRTVLSIWQVSSPELTNPDLGLAILLNS